MMKLFQFKYIVLLGLIFTLSSIETSAQVGIGTTTPNANSMLDITTTTKGMLPPRMTTTERTALGTALTTSDLAADAGMLVYDTSLEDYYYWDATTDAWVCMSCGGVGSNSYSDEKTGGTIYFEDNTDETSVSGNNSFQVEGTTTAINIEGDVERTSNDELRYTGTDTKIFVINCTFTAYGEGNDDVWRFQIYKNSIADGSLKIESIGHHWDNSDKKHSYTISGRISLSTNDEIALYVKNTDGNDDIWVTNMNLSISY